MELILGTKYNKEQFIKLLDNGDCPFCIKNGFKLVLTHINKSHKITAREIKDELLISCAVGFADENTRKQLKNRAKKIGLGISNESTRNKGSKHSHITTKKKMLDLKKPNRIDSFAKMREEYKEKRIEGIQKKCQEKEYKEKITNNIQKANKMFRERVGENQYRKKNNTKIEFDKRSKIKERVLNGEKQNAIAKEYFVSKSLISQIVNS